MVGSTEKCQDGWDPSELLAYLEGDLAPDDRRELEQHLAHCNACSSELELLRGMHRLLKASPQSFHPDEEELYRFVSEAQDPGGRVSAHVETCEECKETMAILRDMTAANVQMPKPPRPIPRPLLRALEARYLDRRPTAEPTSRLASLLDWLRRPFGMPMLAVGTAAAAVVVVAILIPIWTGFKEVPKPEVNSPFEEAPIQSFERKGRLEDLRSPASDYGAKSSEPQNMAERSLPAAKPAPAPQAVSPQRPTAMPPHLEKGEPRKLEERNGGGGPAPSRPRAAAPRSQEVAPGSPSPDRERRVGFQAERVPKAKVAGKPSSLSQEEANGQDRRKVLVRIVPPAGQELQGVKFVPSEEMKSRYLFIEQTGKEEEAAETKDQRLQSAMVAPGGEAYIVTVRISRKGTLYSLEGSLAGPGSTIESETLSRDNVPQGNLQAEITNIVTSLLR